MKVVIVFKDNTDRTRQVLDFLRDFTRFTGKELETIDPETRAGIAFCQVHDIVEYPTVVALDDSGRQLNVWRGLPLPQINEVSYYVQ